MNQAPIENVSLRSGLAPSSRVKRWLTLRTVRGIGVDDDEHRDNGEELDLSISGKVNTDFCGPF